MKKLFSVIITILFANIAHPQNVLAPTEECLFFNEEINEENYLTFVDSIGSQSFDTRLTFNEYERLINCLFSFDPGNFKLNFYKGIFAKPEDINDTSSFVFYRTCIENNYLKNEAYYNMSALIIYNLMEWKENDSMAMYSLTQNEREKYFHIAEKYMLLSYQNGYKEAIFRLANIRKWKNEYLGLPIEKFEFNNDSMTLITKILDCGEFGGHFESMNLIRKPKGYEAVFFADSIFCSNEIPKPSLNSKFNGKKAWIAKNVFRKLVNAMDSYKTREGVISNAPIEIAIVSDGKILYYRIEDFHWPHYLNFRKKTFHF